MAVGGGFGDGKIQSHKFLERAPVAVGGRIIESFVDRVLKVLTEIENSWD